MDSSPSDQIPPPRAKKRTSRAVSQQYPNLSAQLILAGDDSGQMEMATSHKIRRKDKVKPSVSAKQSKSDEPTRKQQQPDKNYDEDEDISLSKTMSLRPSPTTEEKRNFLMQFRQQGKSPSLRLQSGTSYKKPITQSNPEFKYEKKENIKKSESKKSGKKITNKKSDKYLKQDDRKEELNDHITSKGSNGSVEDNDGDVAQQNQQSHHNDLSVLAAVSSEAIIQSPSDQSASSLTEASPTHQPENKTVDGFLKGELELLGLRQLASNDGASSNSTTNFTRTLSSSSVVDSEDDEANSVETILIPFTYTDENLEVSAIYDEGFGFSDENRTLSSSSKELYEIIMGAEDIPSNNVVDEPSTTSSNSVGPTGIGNISNKSSSINNDHKESSLNGSPSSSSSSNGKLKSSSPVHKRKPRASSLISESPVALTKRKIEITTGDRQTETKSKDKEVVFETTVKPDESINQLKEIVDNLADENNKILVVDHNHHVNHNNNHTNTLHPPPNDTEKKKVSKVSGKKSTDMVKKSASLHTRKRKISGSSASSTTSSSSTTTTNTSLSSRSSSNLYSSSPSKTTSTTTSLTTAHIKNVQNNDKNNNNNIINTNINNNIIINNNNINNNNNTINESQSRSKDQLSKYKEELQNLEETIFNKRNELMMLEKKILSRKRTLNEMENNTESIHKNREHLETQYSENDINETLKKFHAADVEKCQKIVKQYLARSHIKLFNANLVRDFISRAEAKEGRLRVKALNEIFDTERLYVDKIAKLFEIYLRPLSVLNIVPQSDLDSVSCYLEIIVDISRILLEKLEYRLSQWPKIQLFGDIFTDFAPAMKLYFKYIRYYSQTSDTLKSFMKYPNYVDFLSDKETKLGSTVQSYFILPVQRLPRYEMLLKALLDKTPEDHVDYENLQHALKSVHSVNMYIEERQKVELAHDQVIGILREQKKRMAGVFGPSGLFGRKVEQANTNIQGYLKATVTRGRFSSEIDTAVRLKLGKDHFETDVIKQSLSPVWSKDFVFEIGSDSDGQTLGCQVLDSKKNALGSVTLDLQDYVVSPNKEIAKSLVMEITRPRSQKSETCEILMSLMYIEGLDTEKL
eukprot:TRINITY_DN458_c0_g2_i1.p1 TRINITY_DN458_c0_g2~~TRINITY_DN458_c0_g2_i1.p1  ORF type:complete len:1090 (-),score=341.39 TRINITY_DN458_c0_g2_i1:138-3407(-)